MVMSLWPRFLAHPLCTIRRIDIEEHRIRIFEQAVRERQREREVYLPCQNTTNTYTLCLRKKQDTKLLPITSPNVNRFSKFFHRHND